MAFGDIGVAKFLRQFWIGLEQFGQITLAGGAVGGARRTGELVEIEDIALELEHRQLAAGMGALLDGAVEHDETRARRRLCQLTAHGEIGDRRLLVAIVVHHDAADGSVRVEFADEDGQPIRRRVEFAFVQQCRSDIGTDVDDLVLHRALTRRHQIEATKIGQRHGDRSGEQDGDCDLCPAKTCRRHDDELAVGVELVESKQGSREIGDRQDDDEQARHYEQRQVDEGRRRLAAIDDEVEQAERLRQPDHRRQEKGKEDGRADHLPKHIDRQSWQSHASSRPGAGVHTFVCALSPLL
jgi:hypothetical protein